MKKRALGVAFMLSAFLLSPYPVAAQRAPAKVEKQQAGRFQIGTDLGFQLGTVDDTALAVGFSGDYFLDSNLSVGPLLQLSFTDDLTQIGFSGQVKYTFDLPGNPNIKPHLQLGLGFVHADLDLPNGLSDSDTSVLVPIGAGVQIRIAKDLWASSNMLFNITDLSLRGRGNDDFYFTWFFGLRFAL